MVGRIFCLWTPTRLHCGNRSHSDCSLFSGSYFGSQKRIHYAVIGVLFFCLFHAMSTVMHSVLSAASYSASHCSSHLLASMPPAPLLSEAWRQAGSGVPALGRKKWFAAQFPSTRRETHFVLTSRPVQPASKCFLSTHDAHSRVSSPLWGTAGPDKSPQW